MADGIDHTSAQSAFVSLAFGLNTIFAAYQHFRNKVGDYIKNLVTEVVAQAKVLELDGKGQLVQNLSEQIGSMSKKHIVFQDYLLNAMIGLAVVMAVVCLTVVYFDLLKSLGFENGYLLLPLPLYLFLSALNYGVFWWNSRCKVKRFNKFVQEFNPPRPPSAPPAAPPSA
jgi:hypothetical protein